MAGVTTTILAGVAAAGAVAGAVAQNEAADAQRDAARAAKQREDLQAIRRRSEMVRQARIAQAQQVVTGETQGATNSSGVQGATSSTLSQLSSNLGLSIQLDRISDQQAARQANAARMMGYATIFGAASSVATAASGYNFGSSSPSPAKATGGQQGIQSGGPTTGPRATVF